MQSRGRSRVCSPDGLSGRGRHHRHSLPRRSCRSLSLSVLVAPGAVAASVSRSSPSDVPRAVVTTPMTGGSGINLPGTTSFDLSTVGYEQDEYFVLPGQLGLQQHNPG